MQGSKGEATKCHLEVKMVQSLLALGEKPLQIQFRLNLDKCDL